MIKKEPSPHRYDKQERKAFCCSFCGNCKNFSDHADLFCICTQEGE